jgi:hypothetical protein
MCCFFYFVLLFLWQYVRNKLLNLRVMQILDKTINVISYIIAMMTTPLMNAINNIKKVSKVDQKVMVFSIHCYIYYNSFCHFWLFVESYMARNLFFCPYFLFFCLYIIFFWLNSFFWYLQYTDMGDILLHLIHIIHIIHLIHLIHIIYLIRLKLLHDQWFILLSVITNIY